MNFKLSVGVVCLSLVLGGCNDDRISRLDKQTQKLETQIQDLKKAEVASDYDLQSKCGHDSKAWFDANWQGDKNTLLLTYSNHYSKRSNRCYIIVEYHHRYSKDWWAVMISLWDVNENDKLGHVEVNHETNYAPQYHVAESVPDCEVDGKKCTTLDEFNNLVRPYLSD